MRILIAVDDNSGFDSRLSSHFGHCPFFAVYDTVSGELKMAENTLDHSDPSSTPVDQVMIFKPDMVVSLGMGRRALALFADKGVKVKTGNFKTVQEVVDDLKSLVDMDKGCEG